MKKQLIKFNIVAILSIIIFAFAVSPVELQNDTFYTIAIGEYILQNGVTMEEPFAWHEGLKYTFPHWAYDVFIYLVHNLGGQVGVYLSTVMLGAILGICIYFVNAKLNKNHLVSFLIALLSMYLLRDFIAARAQLVTFILFILTVFCIERFLETKKKRYAIPLIIIPIIISNVHSAVFPFYFVLFMPYIGEYIVALLSNFDVFILKHKVNKQQKVLTAYQEKPQEEQNEEDLKKIKEDYQAITEKLEKLQLRKQNQESYKIIIEKNPTTKWLIVIAIICAFTGLLTPIGDMPYTYLTRIAEGNTTDSINEHLPMVLAENINFATLLAVTLILLMFTDTKMKLRDWFMLGGLIVLAITTRRQESMVYLIGMIVIAKIITYLFDKYDPEGTKKVLNAATSVCGIIIILALVLSLTLTMIKPKLNEEFVPARSYPMKAADYIIENIDLETMRMYNDYNYGSYLLFRGIPVFIDSRSDLYTPEFNEGVDVFTDYINISNIRVEYEPKFKEYGITHVMVYDASRLNVFLKNDDNYTLLYSDDYFCIYERKTTE